MIGEKPFDPQTAGVAEVGGYLLTPLRGCIQRTFNHSQQLFRSFLEALLQELASSSDKAASNRVQEQFFDAQRLLRESGEGMERAYLNTLERGFVSFQNRELDTNSGVERFEGDLLSLVGYDDLEETIAISSITRRLESSFQVPLWFLNQRFAELIRGNSITNSGNPVAPIQFCEALRAVLRLLELDVQFQLIAYKTFDKYLSSSLASLYEELNQFLAAENILPDVQYSPVASSQVSAPVSVDAVRTDAAPDTQNTTEILNPPGSSEALTGIVGPEDGEGVPNPVASEVIEPSDIVGPIVAPNPNQSAARYQLQLLDCIVKLQRQIQKTGQLAEQSRGLPQYSNQQLVTAVQQAQRETLLHSPLIQSEATQLVPPQSISGASAVFAQALESTKPPGSVDSQHQQTIDLVEMIFEGILSDEKLTDAVKAILSYLHTPFLKLAIMDADFLVRQTEHPARELLNSLADAGALWCGDLGESRRSAGNKATRGNQVYKEIKSVVSRILEEFKSDVRLFIELNHDFRVFTEKLKRRQQLLEKRFIEKAKGKEKLQQASMRVKQEINMRIEGRVLPSNLKPLLHPWVDYLTHVFLRHGDGSNVWEVALTTLTELFWSLEPKVTEADKKRLIGMQDSLLNAIDLAFETISYDKVKRPEIKTRIHALQKIALNTDIHECLEHGNEIAPEVELEVDEGLDGSDSDDLALFAEDVDEEPIAPTPDEQSLIESLEKIEFGALVEFADGQRIKVAWYNIETHNYLLVDQMGKEVGMKTGTELAQLMLKNAAVIIETATKPLFERALEKIFLNLNAQVRPVIA